VRCIVITGAGKAFCSGGDVKDFTDTIDRIGVHIKRLTTDFHGAISRLARTPKPVVMAVNGVAAGAGLEPGGVGGSRRRDGIRALHARVFAHRRSARRKLDYFLPRLIGYSRAMELYLTNRTLSAREAMEMGIGQSRRCGRRVPGRGVQPRARARSRADVTAFGLAKKLFLHSSQESLETQMELEAQAIASTGHSEDFKNGVAAFAKKLGAPEFKGR
jgi:2-(1,2-epoxy-1,2-dihydrophenyl)acetyl-CoA isomerase